MPACSASSDLRGSKILFFLGGLSLNFYNFFGKEVTRKPVITKELVRSNIERCSVLGFSVEMFF